GIRDKLVTGVQTCALPIYPNVDFYSGIVQRALGIPVSMFTCIFSLARTVGWIAQWQEMIADPEYKIGRPRQLYKGAGRRELVPRSEERRVGKGRSSRGWPS